MLILSFVQIVDLNDPLAFAPSSFDFVHSRFVVGGIAQSRWPGYLTDIKRYVVVTSLALCSCRIRVLCSSGWVQLTEWDLTFRTDSGGLESLQSLRRWTETYLTALTSGSGTGRKSRTVPDSLETMMRTSGFMNVSTDVREVPTCGWPTGTLHPGKCHYGYRC